MIYTIISLTYKGIVDIINFAVKNSILALFKGRAIKSIRR